MSEWRCRNVLGLGWRIDPVVKHVADMMYNNLDREGVELEGKLGIMWNDKAFHRLTLGVLTLTPLNPKHLHEYKFRSEVPLEVFKHLNQKVLNARLESARGAGSCELKYSHTTEYDRSFENPDPVDKDKLRVSYDTHNTPLRCVRKQRHQDLDLHNPSCRFDLRVSASTEVTSAPPAKLEACDSIRRKDRMSYSFDIFSIDITMVKAYTAHVSNAALPTADQQPDKITYEVELEIRDIEFVRRERAKLQQGAPNRFFEVAKAFVWNLETLATFANPKMAPPASCRARPKRTGPPATALPAEKRARTQAHS